MSPGRTLWSFVAVAAGAFALACSNGDNISGIDPFTIAKIDLAPKRDTIFVADTISAAPPLQMQAAVELKTGAVRSDVKLVWKSSNPDVAVVDENGVVTPTGLGTTKITASAGEEASAEITVATAPIALSLAPSTVTLIAGESVPLTATATGPAGTRMPGTRYVFTSSAPAVASVDPQGNVQALAPGTTEITVTALDQTARTTVQVFARTFVSAPAGSLSAGDDVTCGLLPFGRAYCFGKEPLIGIARDTTCFDDNASGAAGPRLGCTLRPLRVAGSLNLTQLSAGQTVACAVSADQRAYCWGSDQQGQIGNGGAVNATSPTPALVTTALTFASVSAGGTHACGIVASGPVARQAYCWGADSFGQLGDRLLDYSTTPIPVVPAINFASVTAGYFHTCGLTADNVAYCWGNNASGELAIGPAGGFSEQPKPVTRRFKMLSADSAYTCGIGMDDAAYCWGANDDGQLGSSAGVALSTPTKVPGGFTFLTLDTGRGFVCGLTTGHAIVCWGKNDYGQLGRGEGRWPSTGEAPAVVSGGMSFTSVTAGRRHACGQSGLETYCWGSNVFGALGNGLQAAVRATPQQVVHPD
jgi:alpha-tubulin suppressor-like RCC1 family protein